MLGRVGTCRCMGNKPKWALFGRDLPAGFQIPAFFRYPLCGSVGPCVRTLENTKGTCRRGVCDYRPPAANMWGAISMGCRERL